LCQLLYIPQKYLESYGKVTSFRIAASLVYSAKNEILGSLSDLQ